MLEKDTIVPNSAVSKEDKKIITHTVSYIDSMNYANEIDWLPDNVFYYDNFKKTFGFEEVYDQKQRDGSRAIRLPRLESKSRIEY